MKTQKWISEAQEKFKLFKKLEGLTGDCTHQIDGEIRYEERWLLYPVKGGIQEVYYLQASRVHHTVHVRKENGTLISISEIDASGLPKIQTGV